MPIGAKMTTIEPVNPTALSKAVSHALRHEPWLYELELDAEGWTSVDYLLAALRSANPAWLGLAVADLEHMIAQSEKKRHELRDGKIRAFYGHSTPQKLELKPASPPAILFHGTSPEAAENILRGGLMPMGRQYVHLSADTLTATKVGERKAKTPVILNIDATAAHAEGIAFYHGNEMVWLADFIPSAFIGDK
jgi:putative RNA 2'-phosphotransferase